MRQIQVYNESKKSGGRELVGVLTEEVKGKYSFEYSLSWLESNHKMPIDPSLPLNTGKQMLDSLPSFFSERIPEVTNSYRGVFLKKWGLSPNEKDDLILLATLGQKNSSSFTLEAAGFSFGKNSSRTKSR